jgi:hypothetical protein
MHQDKIDRSDLTICMSVCWDSPFSNELQQKDEWCSNLHDQQVRLGAQAMRVQDGHIHGSRRFWFWRISYVLTDSSNLCIKGDVCSLHIFIYLIRIDLLRVLFISSIASGLIQVLNVSRLFKLVITLHQFWFYKFVLGCRVLQRGPIVSSLPLLRFLEVGT